jgi:hypothetical protein
MRGGRRGYDVALLTTAEPGRRNRRTFDALLLALTALGTATAAVIAKSAPVEDEAVEDAVQTVSGWAEGFWRGVVLGRPEGRIREATTSARRARR